MPKKTKKSKVRTLRKAAKRVESSAAESEIEQLKPEGSGEVDKLNDDLMDGPEELLFKLTREPVK